MEDDVIVDCAIEAPGETPAIGGAALEALTAQVAAAIGAGTRDLDKLQLLYLGNMVDGGLSKYPARCNTATTETIFVNKDGRRDEICAVVLAQKDQRYYIIESADGFTRQYLEDNGYIWVADSIPELAEKIGVPAEALQNSIGSYNACYDAGEDLVFGRTAFAARLEHTPTTPPSARTASTAPWAA